jgi:endonuclease-3
MSSPSRTSQFAKLHKVLKKHYKPVAPRSDRPVLEHLLFACCLENAHYEAAEEALAALEEQFYDWNEVRVSTVRELSEVMPRLPNPAAAATRIRNVLQHVFEATYTFDLEELRKKNLGPATDRLQKVNGVTEFGVAYVVQAALGGHAIPTGEGELRAMHVVGLISDKELQKRQVAGLERAIAKSKGIEFGSLLHQLGADFIKNPYSPSVRKILLEINPDAKDRLPKRRSKRQAESRAAAAETPAEEPTPAGAKKAKTTKKAAPSSKKPKKSETKPKSSKKKASKTPPPKGKKKKAAASEGKRGAKKSAKKSASRKISKRKPR